MKPSDIVKAASPYGPRFQKWLEFILTWEVEINSHGEIIIENVKSDHGTATFAGIDHASPPNFDYTNPTSTSVAQIYFHDYWSKVSAEALGYPIGEAVANFGVNMGVNRAGRMLQTILGFNPHSGAVDGIIGPKTIAATKSFSTEALACLMIDAGDERYRNIANNTHSQFKFLKGWLNRNAALEKWLGLSCK